jgi:SAM-dependent methyltransferase
MSEFNSLESGYSGIEILTDLTLATNYNSHLKLLLQKNYRPGASILDFGAGNGHFLNIIGDKHANLFAVEPVLKLRNLIQDSALAKLIEAKHIQPDSFDFIYSLNTLEHIEDDQSVFDDFFKWLKPGGRLLVYVPALPHLYSRFDAAIGHFRRYKRSEIIEKARAAGFHVEAAKFMDPAGYFLALAYRLFFNSGKLTQRQAVLFDKYLYPLSKVMSPVTSNLFGKNLILTATK